MSRYLIASFFASLLLHVAGLLMLQLDFSQPPPGPPLLARLVIPPRPLPVPQKVPPQKKERRARAEQLPAHPAGIAGMPSRQESVPLPENGIAPAAGPAIEPEAVESFLVAPVQPQIPVQGVIRYKFIVGTQDFEAGRAEAEWTFADGHYHFRLMAESTGLAWMVKSIRIESESEGKLIATGLQPERYRYTRKVKGKEAVTAVTEFDWDKRELVLAGHRQPMKEGIQDLLSVQYQFIYLPDLVEGAMIGIATHKKFENHRLHVVGEEELETPHGIYRTLRVVVRAEKRQTELWLARDYGLLPFRVRHVDPQDTYELLMTEIGTPQK